jgi:hypothetical protein
VFLLSLRGETPLKNTKAKEGATTMQREEQTTQSADIPKWSALLVEAVNKPGTIMKAYSAFWNYSVGIRFSRSFNANCAA